MTPSTRDAPPDGTTRRKSVLHCPDCGHESHIEGDWRVERHSDGAGREQVCRICPNCGRIIDSRSSGLLYA